MRSQHLQTSTAAIVVALLATACGGGSDTASTTPENTSSTQKTIVGQLTVPKVATATQSLAFVRSARTTIRATVQCPNLPDGYDPIANTVVDILDAADKKIGELTTDSCGTFNTTVADTASALSVTVAGYKPLKTDVINFTSNNVIATASTPPANAKYVITSIQYLGSGAIAFTLTDDITNKAVLGLPLTAVSVLSNQKTLSVKSLDTALTKQDPASVMLVLDASGSMSDQVVAATATTPSLTRFDLASAASHLFLTGKQAVDEVSFTIFDSQVTEINDTYLGTLSFADATTKQPATYTISDTGFTTDVAKLRPVADIYNTNNKMWGAFNKWGTPTTQDRHADNPYIVTKGSYSWGNMTALWKAASQGLEALSKRTNKRKLLVAMTDGQDNMSDSFTSATLITQAKNAGIPVHMVAFGSQLSVNETDMQAVASQTGGEYQRREDASITDLFKSIQTGIRNQYTLQVADTIAAGTPLTLSVQLNQTSVSRDVTSK